MLVLLDYYVIMHMFKYFIWLIMASDISKLHKKWLGTFIYHNYMDFFFLQFSAAYCTSCYLKLYLNSFFYARLSRLFLFHILTYVNMVLDKKIYRKMENTRSVSMGTQDKKYLLYLIEFEIITSILMIITNLRVKENRFFSSVQIFLLHIIKASHLSTFLYKFYLPPHSSVYLRPF